MEAAFDDLDLFVGTAAGDVRDPYPDFAEARKNTPVAQREHYFAMTNMVFRYDDVVEVLKDPETFPSYRYEQSIGLVFGPNILQMDGTDHVVHRGLVASTFRRKAIEGWTESLIQPTVDQLIDTFTSRGSAELVREFTIRFPIRVIASILGIPLEDGDRFARLSLELISIAFDIPRGFAASQALREYFAELLAERRKEPRDDLISALAAAQIDGTQLPDEEIFGFLRLLLPAGAETTYRLLGNLLFALLSDREQYEMVRADRSLVPNAIEEALRWESPVQTIARTPTRDVSLAGVALQKDSSLTLMLGSANRDESKFDDPDRFDVRRPNAHDHVAFAEGPHRCLGEHLARIEVTAALNTLIDRLPEMRLDPGDRDPHVHGSAFRSPTSLPVVFTPEG